MRKTQTNRRDHAFTLIELLVVIAIIALLMGILLPTLGAARSQAHMACELAASRSLMIGYTSYSIDNGDYVIKGVGYEKGVEVRDNFGTLLYNGVGSPANIPLGVTVKRYPFRLAPWLDYKLEGTAYVNTQAGQLHAEARDLIMNESGGGLTPAQYYAYVVSEGPSFGLNVDFLGGNEAEGKEWIAECKPLRRTELAVDPSNLLVFASAYGGKENGNFSAYDAFREGFSKVQSPDEGALDFEAAVAADEARPNNNQEFLAAWGYVHPRWGGSAVTAMLDGSSTLRKEEEFRDMRLWSNEARRQGNPNLRPKEPDTSGGRPK